MAKGVKTKLSVDDQLTECLRIAEDALIRAVKLFSEDKTLNRRVGYLPRLLRAQEGVTGLHREELVRVLAVKGGKGRKRR